MSDVPADPREFLRRPAAPPDAVLRYGDHPEQVADLWLPGSPATPPPGSPAPLLVLLHGGFWRQDWDRAHVGPMAAALATEGWAVVAPEYRRTGGGGGWPATFDDVAVGVARVPALAAAAAHGRGVELAARFALAGHSAGGHLALWAAARHRLPERSRWHRAGADPALSGVLGLAAVGALAEAARLGLDDGAAVALVGADPDSGPDRYAEADPTALLPSGVPTILLHGAADAQVPVALAYAFADAAREQGDLPDLRVLPGVGHFGLIDPLSPTFGEVRGALDALPR